jgi:hypothetical protein
MARKPAWSSTISTVKLTGRSWHAEGDHRIRASPLIWS